jgi:dTDP-4-amino-4,6-dideoxygalactose transaminase
MFDLLKTMVSAGMADKIFLPAYIGWSPKEGSGIFDPLSKIAGLDIEYYKITEELNIDCENLFKKITANNNKNFAVLLVNYFGFVDSNAAKIAEFIKNNNGWIIEDNAHGFFTYQNTAERFSDATFFSLHKMFPFNKGGSLIVRNERLKCLNFNGTTKCDENFNP